MIYFSLNQISIYSFIGAFIGCKIHEMHYIALKTYNKNYNGIITIFYYNYFINISCIIGFIMGTIYGKRTRILGIYY